MLPTMPMPLPSTVVASANAVASGHMIPPIERIRIFCDSQWEDFILEWANSLRQQYALVERCGGAGDMGRDVIAHVSQENGCPWDNYQCKHYDHPLAPSDIYRELGKLAYYTYTNEFTYPRAYYFVAPQGVGTKLANYLRQPQKLKELLLENWDSHCSNKITSKAPIFLDEPLKRYIQQLDFSIISYIPPLKIIEQHSTTPYHVARFGGGLPERPTSAIPPQAPEIYELGYVSKLLEAYGDHLRESISAPSDIDNEQELKEHFADSRIQFYSAESLRSFSRDYLPPGEFEKLQNEVHDGIRDDIRDDHPSGYKRVMAVVKTARNLQLTSHPLISKLTVRDRGGICHQLANDKDEVRWVKK